MPTPPNGKPRCLRLEATSFQARPREIVAILGPNASGKSTLLKLISGSSSRFRPRGLNGFATSRLAPATRAQRIAMVQQESPLIFPFARLAITFCRDATHTAARYGLKMTRTSLSP